MTAQARLPIDVIPGTIPLSFQWKQRVTTFADGSQTIDHEGSLPASVELAVVELITLAKTLMGQNSKLRVTLGDMARRLEVMETAQPTPVVRIPSKKSKGGG